MVNSTSVLQFPVTPLSTNEMNENYNCNDIYVKIGKDGAIIQLKLKVLEILNGLSNSLLNRFGKKIYFLLRISRKTGC
jgi:hypothetical protein